MTAFQGAFKGKRVFLTGHTGFKGGWLAEWLLGLGARVTGYSLLPVEPSLFTQLELHGRLERNIFADINDREALRDALIRARPDFVFHLAAQPLVRESYAKPFETWMTNVMGTVNVMEVLRELARPCSAVLVTTDKCYENREWLHGYRETDPLGGRDPYSASKAAAEIAIASYRSSFFENHPVRIASVRAGNVIGGGDWAADRIVPDAVRALSAGKRIQVRNPAAIRPWQHVLEPLSGYLWLAAQLQRDPKTATAFNFGPGHDANRTVEDLVEEILVHWPGRWQDQSDPNQVHEAKLLQLSTDKANALLNWQPVLTFSDGVRETIRWYRASTASRFKPKAFTAAQIRSYTAAATKSGLAWALN